MEKRWPQQNQYVRSATEIITERNKARLFGGFFSEVFFCLEKEEERDQTYVLNTYLEYEFHDRKMLWNRLESNFHIGPFSPPSNPVACKKDLLQNPVTRLIE